ncbi:MAG TPA: hypothetical protein DIT18_02955 [Pseudomonas sp.]|nr:hypothetical protein [Pseudomonas sp.]
MIFAHNHPSCDVTPSTKDKMFTHKLMTYSLESMCESWITSSLAVASLFPF